MIHESIALSSSPVAGCQVPSAAGLRDWFRRAAHCRAAAPLASRERLRGVNVALLHSRAAGGRETLLHQAIGKLGANAVSIEFNEGDESARARDISVMARVLGRLYDAVDCAGMAPSTVRSIALGSGVPVFCDLGCDQHPVRAIGEIWTIEQVLGDAANGRRIRFIGNPKTEPAPAFVVAATRLGFDVEIEKQRSRDVLAPFTVEASDPSRWKLKKGATPLSRGLRLDNCANLIQALLVREIAGS